MGDVPRPTDMALAAVGLTALLPAACAGGTPATPPGLTVFSGARVIVGDERPPIENATILVQNGRIQQIGVAGSIEPPAGAPVVDLTGKTVMLTIIDTHVHLGTTRDDLMRDLRQRAYFGVSAALSLARPGRRAVPGPRRGPAGVARYFTAGRGITMPEPGRSEVPYWVTTEDEARKAVQEQAALKVDIIKIWVTTATAAIRRCRRRSTRRSSTRRTSRPARRRPHLQPLRRQGLLKPASTPSRTASETWTSTRNWSRWSRSARTSCSSRTCPTAASRWIGWLSGSIPAGQLEKIQAASTDRPAAQAAWGIQARNSRSWPPPA